MPARILIVEDTPHNLALMRYLLEARGHSIVAATSGSEGKTLAREGNLDLVILDLQLGDSTGFDVLLEMRVFPELAAVPFIAVTAFAMVGDRDRVLSSGFDGYIPKPLEPLVFAEQVESFLHESRRGVDSQPKPLVLGEPSDEGSDSRKGEAPARGTILVVDDRRQNLDLARGIFKPSGYEVLLAPTIEAALEILRERSPHLVICDIHFAEGNALDILEPLYGSLVSKASILFHSATATPEDMNRIEKLGARFLARPVDPVVLLELVSALIAETSSGTQES